MLQGRNLMILANGSVIAGSKSCQLSVNADHLKVASPTDGEWEHVIAGRKSWSVSTSHLLPSILSPKPLISGFSPSWININDPVQVRVGSLVKSYSLDRGLTIFDIVSTNGVYRIVKKDTYDTGYDADDVTAMTSAIEVATLGTVAQLILSRDAWSLPASLGTAIGQTWHVPNIPTISTSTHGAIAIIGSDDTTAKGICIYGEGHEGAARASVYLEGGVIQTIETVLRNAVARVGQMLEIRVQVDGYGDDYLKGEALCATFDAQGTNGNLLTGSFKFVGNGPLT